MKVEEIALWAIGPVLGFAAWVGRIQTRVTRNREDLSHVVEILEEHIKEDRKMHERIAGLETNVNHLVKWVDRQDGISASRKPN
jgi:hypothetical protein